MRQSHKRFSFAAEKKNPVRPSRIIAIGVIFLLVCAVYFVQLIVLRISGSHSNLFSIYDGGISKRTITVSAVRGDIYDRNGRLLVSSKTVRDMTLTYDAIPDSSEELNRSIADAVRALREKEIARADAEFPLYGTYPSYGYYAEAIDPESEYYKGIQTVLKALSLPVDTDCETLVKTMTSRYKLTRSGLTDEQIDDVFRVRYDMLRLGFGVYTPFVLARDVSDGLYTYVSEKNISGVVFVARSERIYSYPGYASHVLGAVGQIPEGALADYTALGYPMDAIIGLSGCEMAYEQYLRGIDGTMIEEYNEEGILINRYYEKEPTAGLDVYLTIDIDVQIAAEDALKENIENISSVGGALSGADADAGAAVAMDPDDFSVIAIASYPTYDLSTYGLEYGDLLLDARLPLLNRALDGTYEPGSTFKIGVALAALEEKIISPSTEINDTGVYTYYPGYHPRCWIYTEQGHGHGPITVSEAIQVSCNYFFYEVGRLLGIDRITDYMEELGLGKSTGIELSEKTGILASPEYRDENGETPWTSGDTLQAAIGQSNNLFTPLQMACYFSTVFNGGNRYSAHLLSSVNEFYTGDAVDRYVSTLQNQVRFSDKTYETLMGGITDVIDNNATLTRYFKDLKAAGVTVGGKTGTAQVSSESSDNAIFSAYGEYNGRKLVAVCVIEHGSSGSYAGYTVSRVMEKYFLSETEGGIEHE